MHELTSQSPFDEYLFTGPYEDTEGIADLQIDPGSNPESSEFFSLSWINEGSQAADTVEAPTAQGFYWTASGIQPQENQTAAGIPTLTQQPLSQPGDNSTQSRKNIREPTDAKKRLEKKRGYDKAYRERVKQKRQKLEVENLEKDEQMKAFKAEIRRLNAENAEIQGHEQLMKSNLAELKGENKSLKEENILLNQRLQTKSRETDQLQHKVKDLEQLIMMLKKRLEKLAKKIVIP